MTEAPRDAGTGALGRMARRPVVIAALAMLFWASSLIVVRAVRGEVPPLGLSFWRSFLGFLIIVPFIVAPLRRDLPVLLRHWRMLGLLGFLMFVGGNASLFIGLQDTEAINAGLINSFEPVVIILMAWLLFRDPVSLRQLAGVLISLSGVAMLISRGRLDGLAALDFNRGDLWVLVAITSWGLYAALLRRAPQGIHPLSSFAATVFIGSMMLLPLYVWEIATVGPTPLSRASLVSIGVLAVFSTVLGVVFWNRALGALGAGRAGLFLHLIPAYTVILAVIFLGERLALFHLAGIALIATGIFLTSRRARVSRPG
jgi:drug/metabolite transporter (DMT)-like permease